jgi:hypothetical protein
MQDRKLRAEIIRELGEVKGLAGARLITRRLALRGIKVNERTVRYHLKILDEMGLTENVGRAGRKLTRKGIQELKKISAYERLGFSMTRMDSMLYEMKFDPFTGKGLVTLDVGLLDSRRASEALDLVKEVVLSGFSPCRRIKLVGSGKEFGTVKVPKGSTALFSVGSVAIDGALFYSGIPIRPRFGGTVEIISYEAIKFTDIITYEGTTLNPAEIFASRRITSILKAVRDGSGLILASYKEFPEEALPEVENVLEVLYEKGFNRALQVGGGEEPVLGILASLDRGALAVSAGMNPIVALQEAGIPIVYKSLSTLAPFLDLEHVDEVKV